MGLKKERESYPKLKLVNIQETRVVCSNEPFKLDYIKLKNPFLLSHNSRLSCHYHKEKYQWYKTIVQTYLPPNPNVHEDNSTILSHECHN